MIDKIFREIKTDNDKIKELCVMKKISLKRERYVEICKNEYKYDKRKRKKEKLFENRISYRDDLYSLNNKDINYLINGISMAADYRPTPMAGNQQCIYFLIHNEDAEDTVYFFSLIDGEQVRIKKFDNVELFVYIETLKKREDIKGSGGTYLFPMMDARRLLDKYGEMGNALLFCDLGCVLQNIIILLEQRNIRSCIHFGVQEYKQWSNGNLHLFTPCLLRCGYAKD